MKIAMVIISTTTKYILITRLTTSRRQKTRLQTKTKTTYIRRNTQVITMKTIILIAMEANTKITMETIQRNTSLMMLFMAKKVVAVRMRRITRTNLRALCRIYLLKTWILLRLYTRRKVEPTSRVSSRARKCLMLVIKSLTEPSHMAYCL